MVREERPLSKSVGKPITNANGVNFQAQQAACPVRARSVSRLEVFNGSGLAAPLGSTAQTTSARSIVDRSDGTGSSHGSGGTGTADFSRRGPRVGATLVGATGLEVAGPHCRRPATRAARVAVDSRARRLRSADRRRRVSSDDGHEHVRSSSRDHGLANARAVRRAPVPRDSPPQTGSADHRRVVL